MQNPTTPGVSVEEITVLPNSVSLIDTAIPVFIGYTEHTPADHTIPLSISSLMEYEKHFGKAKKESIRLKDTEDIGDKVQSFDVKGMYDLYVDYAEDVDEENNG